MNKALKKNQPEAQGFVFEKRGYIILLSGIVLIIIGFMLMSGGGSEDPKVLNPEIFSFRRITLAPLVVMLGFAVEVYAIMRKPKI